MPARWFYVWMAGACALIAFVGFAPTYWLQLAPGTFIGSPLLHLHALLFSAWPLYLLLQTTLAARGRVDRHRAWGLLGVSLATAMVFVGFAVANEVLATRLAAGYGDRARAFHIASTSIITLFGVFVFAAIAYVQRPEIHKRLMLLATISMLPPAIARLFFAVSVGIGPGLRPGLGPPRTVESVTAPSAHRRCVDPRRHDLRHAHARPAPSRVPRRRRHHPRRPGSACAREHDAVVVYDRGFSRAVQRLRPQKGNRHGKKAWDRIISAHAICSPWPFSPAPPWPPRFMRRRRRRSSSRASFRMTGQIGLFIAARDGSGERPLLATRGMDYDPVWSPDGQSIVFTSDREGSADLFRVKPDGSGLERLTDSPAYDDQAAFSPDGRQLVLVTTRAGGKPNLWTLDIATRRMKPLTSGAGGDFRPSWSPDGQWIAFSSSRGRALTFAHGRWEHLQFADIYVVRPDGTRIEAGRRSRQLLRQPEMDGRQPPPRGLLHGRAEDARDAAGRHRSRATTRASFPSMWRRVRPPTCPPDPE